MNEKAIEAGRKAAFDFFRLRPLATIKDFEKLAAAVLAAALPPLRAREEIARDDALRNAMEPFIRFYDDIRFNLRKQPRPTEAAVDQNGERYACLTWAHFYALKDAFSITAGQEWRDISSAPKDGTPLLGFMPTYYQGRGGQSIILWQDAAWWDNRAFKTDPSHWMPLPAPPVAEPPPAGVDREPVYLKQQREHPNE